MKTKLPKRHLLKVLLLSIAVPATVFAQNVQTQKPKQCRTVKIQAVCGTEKVCQELKGRGMQCWTQEKYCIKTTESCS